MSNINFKTSVKGRYKIQILSRGIIVEERPWADNMVLNQGKNWIMAGVLTYAASFSHCAVGTGSTPVAATDTGLTAEATTARSSTYLTGVGNCGLTTVGQTMTNRRTFDFPIETVNQNYSELGWSYAATKANNLFSKTLISGGTVTVLAEQQLRVIYDLSVSVEPTGVQIGTITIAGWGTLDCTYALQQLNMSYVTTAGATTGSAGFFEFSAGYSASARISTAILSSFGSMPTGSDIIGSAGLTSTLSTYIADSFTRTATFGYWSASSWTSTNVGMFSYSRLTDGLALKFNVPQTKLNTYRLRPPGLVFTLV